MLGRIQIEHIFAAIVAVILLAADIAVLCLLIGSFETNQPVIIRYARDEDVRVVQTPALSINTLIGAHTSSADAMTLDQMIQILTSQPSATPPR